MIDATDPPSESTINEPDDRNTEMARILDLSKRWQSKEAERFDHEYYVRGEAMRDFWRRTSRAVYARAKAERGEVVRTYIKRDRSITDYEGTHEERLRQLACDYARDRRGKDENTVRSHTDLSAMTEQEKEEHRRRKATQRKREQRERDRKKRLS